MRKVTYVIDDYEYFKNLYMGVDNLEDILNAVAPFRCRYTLIGEDYERKYLLEDMDGNNLNISSLNGYQKGIVLCDCQRHFQGKPLESGGELPTGCIKIEEDIIDGDY